LYYNHLTTLLTIINKYVILNETYFIIKINNHVNFEKFIYCIASCFETME